MERKRQKLMPEKSDVQKECQDPKITALERKLEHMENKLKLVIAELEQVKEERARDKINFETEKCELESENEKLQSENEKLQSENKRLQKYLQDLESSNINAEEKSKINLYNTGLNSQITKVNKTNDAALNINSFPNEIILKVFSYLTQNQLGQIARVCRRWNVLTKSPLLWRKVNVKIFSSDTETNAITKSFINGLPPCVSFIRLDFAELDFSEWEDLISIDFEELCAKLHQKCPHLEELILVYCAITNILPEVINFCTQFLQCVKKLVFHYSHFSDHSRTVELNDNSKIEVLDLYCCTLFSRTQFSKLLYLKELRLNKTYVDDTWFEDEASFFNQLHVLDMGITRITASTFLAIQNHSHNLKELYLCNLNLEAHGLNFSKSVFPQLKTICLSSYHITCEVVVSLIQSRPSLQNVYVNRDVARSFVAHPFVLANRCKSGIVKLSRPMHLHNIDYFYSTSLHIK